MKHFDAMRGKVFNVGDESMNYTKREITEKIKNHVDFYLHEAAVGSDPDQRDYEVDYNRLRSVGFRANVGLEAGIAELVKILRVLTISNPLRNA
jgi:nucleoside-diphosphate-sugar epimerase